MKEEKEGDWGGEARGPPGSHPIMPRGTWRLTPRRAWSGAVPVGWVVERRKKGHTPKCPHNMPHARGEGLGKEAKPSIHPHVLRKRSPGKAQTVLEAPRWTHDDMARHTLKRSVLLPRTHGATAPHCPPPPPHRPTHFQPLTSLSLSLPPRMSIHRRFFHPQEPERVSGGATWEA